MVCVMAGLVPAIHVYISRQGFQHVDARNRRGYDDKRSPVTLAPLLNAAPVIQLHAYAAMTALALGIVQLSAPRVRFRIGRSAGSGWP
jgi:hypothetical protein